MYKIVVEIRFLIVLATAVGASRAWAETARQQYRLAAGFYQTKDWQSAVDRFQQFVADHPQDEQAPAATFFIGEALVQLGKYGEARNAFQRFLDLRPDHSYAAQAMFRVGECDYLRGDDQTARNDLRKFHRRFPDEPLNAYVLPYLGELALALNDPKDAEAKYQLALQKFPAGPLAEQCRLGLGRAFELQGNYEQALRFYRFLSRQSQTALADDAFLQEGMLAYNTGSYAEAEQTLKQFLVRFSNSELATDAGYWLGMSQLKQQRWKEAAETLKRARPSDSDHKLAPGIEFATAEALRKTGRSKEADDHYARLVTVWPNSKWGDDSLQARVQIALDAGDYVRVEQLSRSFESEYPDSGLLTLVRQSKGQALLAEKQYSKAGRTFQKLLADTAEASRDDQIRWNYLLARAQVGEGDHEGVLQSLVKIPRNALSDELMAGVSMTRATALFNLERYDEAVEAYRGYLQHLPDGADAAQCRAQLAISLAKLNRFEESKESFDQLVTSYPDDSLIAPTAQIVAEAAYARKQWNVARALFPHLAAVGNPDHLRAKGISGLAWTRVMQGAKSEAAGLFKNVLDQFPESKSAPEAAFMRARLLDQLGRRQEAVEAYDAVIEQFPNSAYESQSLWRSTQLLQSSGDPAASKVVAERLKRLTTDYPELPYHDAVLYQRAWLLIDVGRTKDALPLFEKVVSEYPKSAYWADSAYRLADNAFRSGNYQRARRFAGQLVNSDAKGEILSYGLYLQGQIAANQSRWSDVIRPLSRLLDQFPEASARTAAEYWIAEAYYRQRNYAEAGRRFGQLLHQTKDAKEDWLAIVPMRRAQVYAHQKKWLDAYEVAKGIQTRFPNFAQQHEVDYLIGRSLAARAKFSEARLAYKRVVESPPARNTELAAMSQWMIGETYFHQKKLDEAIEAYHRTYSLYDFPDWQAAALLQAGKCHEAKGQASEANRLYQQVLSDFPHTSFQKKARQQLELLKQKSATASRAVSIN